MSIDEQKAARRKRFVDGCYKALKEHDKDLMVSCVALAVAVSHSSEMLNTLTVSQCLNLAADIEERCVMLVCQLKGIAPSLE